MTVFVVFACHELKLNASDLSCPRQHWKQVFGSFTLDLDKSAKITSSRAQSASQSSLLAYYSTTMDVDEGNVNLVRSCLFMRGYEKMEKQEGQKEGEGRIAAHWVESGSCRALRGHLYRLAHHESPPLLSIHDGWRDG